MRRKREEHVAGHGSHHYLLWDVLMFQAWFEAQRSETRSETLLSREQFGSGCDDGSGRPRVCTNYKHGLMRRCDMNSREY
jgi:hypothetical protein